MTEATDNNHLHMIRHFAHQTGATPVHLDNESVKSLRNLSHLVNNETVEHDFSNLKSLFSKPHIANYLKQQIEQKKANGGVINDYLNTLKQNGSGGNPELSLVPHELVKFLDDSYSLGTINDHTGHKEYHLGKMFDGLNNIFKPVRDSMGVSQNSPAPILAQVPAQMPQVQFSQAEQPREHHAWGDMIGSVGGAATGAYNSLPSLPMPSFGNGFMGKVASNVGNTASAVGSAAYNNLPSFSGGNNSNIAQLQNPPAEPGYIQSAMRNVAGTVGSGVGGLSAQYAGQKVGNTLGSRIPIVGPFVSPIVGQMAGNAAYNIGANRGKATGTQYADKLYNYLSGSKPPAVNPSPANSGLPSFSSIGSAAAGTSKNIASGVYNAATSFGNAAYDAGKKVYDTAAGAGKYIYNNLPTLPGNPFSNLSPGAKNVSSSSTRTAPLAYNPDYPDPVSKGYPNAKAGTNIKTNEKAYQSTLNPFGVNSTYSTYRPSSTPGSAKNAPTAYPDSLNPFGTNTNRSPKIKPKKKDVFYDASDEL